MDQDKTTVMGGYGSAQAGDSADATRVVPNPGYTDPAATQPSAEPTRVIGVSPSITIAILGASEILLSCRIFARPLWQRSSGPV